MAEVNKGQSGSIFHADEPGELTRLLLLERFMKSLGNPLAGLPDEAVEKMESILDLACGTGGWVLDVAYACPDVNVCGIESSQSVIAYAHARATTQRLPNASFRVMDIRQPLDFSNGCFDLINARFLGEMLLHEQWSPLLAECFRLVKPGGVMRLTESENLPSTSLALTCLYSWLTQARHRAGYGFAHEQGERVVIPPLLPSLLAQAGFEDITLDLSSIDCSARSPQGRDYFRLAEATFFQARTLIIDQELATESEYDQTWYQATIDMHLDSFAALHYGLSVWGKKPEGAAR